MRHKSAISVFMLITIILSSCDMGSYNPIAKALDPFESLGSDSTAWMNASGTKGSSKTTVLILQEGAPVNRNQGGYVYIEIQDNKFPSPQTEIILTRGIYAVNGGSPGIIELRPSAEYRGTYRETSSPSNNPDPISREGELLSIEYSYNSSNRELSLGSGPLVFSPLGGEDGVLDSIYKKSNTFIRAMQLQLIYQIGIYASQVIVPGFGGTGMMTYYNSSTPFKGLVDGKENILMSKLLPLARVDFDYDGMVNIPGMKMSGRLRTDSNASGSGSMSETVHVEISDGFNPVYNMAVSYDGISITGTIPRSGSYTDILSVNNTPENISYLEMTPGNMDFPGIFP
jgi:hypothetical protein